MKSDCPKCDQHFKNVAELNTHHKLFPEHFKGHLKEGDKNGYV